MTEYAKKFNVRVTLEQRKHLEAKQATGADINTQIRQLIQADMDKLEAEALNNLTTRRSKCEE